MPPLTTAGCDIATADSMREILGDVAMVLNVTPGQWENPTNGRLTS